MDNISNILDKCNFNGISKSTLFGLNRTKYLQRTKDFVKIMPNTSDNKWIIKTRLWFFSSYMDAKLKV